MSAWGTSLYSNDADNDIRGDYVDKLKRGKTNEVATRELIEENSDIIGSVEEEPLFWFALADTQWNYGRLLSEVKEKALQFLLQEKELERWAESGLEQSNKWKTTLNILEEKLQSPQPLQKKVSKYRFFQCKWQLGDVFAYRFSSDFSNESGLLGKYVLFKKVSEDTWWPGHRIPVIRIYKWIGTEIPKIAEVYELEYLPLCTRFKYHNKTFEYDIKLVTESEKSIPKENLTFVGNISGNDIVPFRGHDFWTGYYPVGWEKSKCNTKFEQYIIHMYNYWINEN